MAWYHRRGDRRARIRDIVRRLRGPVKEGVKGKVFETKLTERERTGSGPLVRTTVVERGRSVPGHRDPYVARVVTEKERGRVLKRVVTHGFGQSLIQKIKEHVNAVKRERLRSSVVGHRKRERSVSRRRERSRTPAARRAKRRRTYKRVYTTHELLLMNLGQDSESHIQFVKTFKHENALTDVLMRASVVWGDPSLTSVGLQMGTLAMQLVSVSGQQGPEGRLKLYKMFSEQAMHLNIPSFAIARAAEMYVAANPTLVDAAAVRRISTQFLTQTDMPNTQFGASFKSLLEAMKIMRNMGTTSALADFVYDVMCIAIDLLNVVRTILGYRKLVLRRVVNGETETLKPFIMEKKKGDAEERMNKVAEAAKAVFANLGDEKRIVKFRMSIRDVLNDIVEVYNDPGSETKRKQLAEADSFVWLGTTPSFETPEDAILVVGSNLERAEKANWAAKGGKEGALSELLKTRITLYEVAPTLFCGSARDIGDQVILSLQPSPPETASRFFANHCPSFMRLTSEANEAEESETGRVLPAMAAAEQQVFNAIANFIAPGYKWSAEACKAIKDALSMDKGSTKIGYEAIQQLNANGITAWTVQDYESAARGIDNRL